MNDAILRTIPRAYFDQAQHMLRYAPHPSHKYFKVKQRFGWGLLSDRGRKVLKVVQENEFNTFRNEKG
jgi:hypothetical protein